MSEASVKPLPVRGGRLLVRFWFEYAHKHKATYALGALCLLATNGLSALAPKLVQWSVEALEAEQSALKWAVALLGVGLATIVVRTLSRTLIFNPGREVEYDLKRELFAHLLRLPTSYYERELSAGELINRGTNDAAAVRGLIGYGSLQALNVSMTLVITLSQMTLIDPSLTLMTLGPLLVGALVLRWVVLQMFTIMRSSMEQVGALGDLLLESYGAVSVVQSFGATEGVSARFDRDNQALLELGERMQRLTVWGLPIVSVMGALCVALLLGFGGPRVAQGELSLGALTALIVYVTALVSCITSLGWLTGAIQRGYLSLIRIYEVLDAPLDLPERPAELPESAVEGVAMRVEGLTFTHATASEPTLKNMSFELKPGEVVGVFGLTGSGKSTLLDVLSRTYDPPQGSVWLDGVEATQLHPRDYWSRLAYVQQQAFLFSESLEQNVTLGQDRSKEALEQALEAACLTSEVESFPEGVNTKVGERGVTLSGGQRQRTALARAFYRQGYQLLLLDDVLSAVDHATELKLIESIYAREPRCTTLIVSHRMSVLQRADRVLVIDNGELVEEGTPQALASGEGLYAQAWRAQRLEDEAVRGEEER